MDLSVLALFVPACLGLNMIPGPNNLMSMHNGQSHGVARAVIAGVGRLLAFLLMISLAAFGLAAVLYTSEILFNLIRIAGAGYLFWVALQLWRKDSATEAEQAIHSKSISSLAYQEFLLAASNPKAILIFTAFLPQFVRPGYAYTEQLLTLGLVFLLLECLAILIYASLGAYLRRWFARQKVRRLFNRICATFIAGVGVGLLLEQQGSS